MGSLSSIVKKYDLIVEQNCLYGRVGFSICQNSIIPIIKSIQNYIISKNLSRVVVGYDYSLWSNIFWKEIIFPYFKKSGTLITHTNSVITKMELSWLLSESKTPSMGLYFGNPGNTEDYLGISLYNNSGIPFSPKEMKSLLSMPTIHKTILHSEINTDLTEEVDISKYYQYLLDKGLVSSSDSTINIDTMFGSSENLLKNLKQVVFPNIRIFNLGSDFPRLLNYTPIPTGKFLQWYTSYNCQPTDYYFAINSDGSSVGVFDLNQKIEISGSGVVLLLLKYLKEVRSFTKGEVLLSIGLPKRVRKYAKFLGYTVKLVKTPTMEECRENTILYADDSLHYSFPINGILVNNPLVAISSIISLCSLEKKSPGEIIDSILLLIRDSYKFSLLTLSKSQISYENLQKIIYSMSKVSSKGIKNSGTVEVKISKTLRLILSSKKTENIHKISFEYRYNEELTNFMERLNNIL